MGIGIASTVLYRTKDVLVFLKIQMARHIIQKDMLFLTTAERHIGQVEKAGKLLHFLAIISNWKPNTLF